MMDGVHQGGDETSNLEQDLLNPVDEAFDVDETLANEGLGLSDEFERLSNEGREPFRSIFDKTHARGLIALCKLLLESRDDLPARIELCVRIKWRDLLNGLYDANHSPSDLAAAVEVGTSLLPLVPEENDWAGSQKPQHLDKLCFMKTSLFLATDNVTQIDDAVRFGREAWKEAQTLRPWDQRRYDALSNLGYALSTRYKKTWQLGDLDEAIQYARLSLDPARMDPGKIITILSQLSVRLYLRFEKTGNAEDRDRAMALSEQVVLACSQDNPVRSSALSLLCQESLDKFELTGFWRDLEEAIRLAKLAFSSLSEGDELRPQCAESVARLLTKRYGQTKDFSDLKEALDFSKQWVAMTPHRHGIRGKRLFIHLQRLKEVAKSVFESADLDEILEQAFELLALMPEDYSHAAINRRLLVDILSRRYELSGLPSDLVPLVSQALGIGVDDVSQYEAEHGGPSLKESGCLLGLFSKVMTLAAHPLENNIVAQISGSFHQEYLKRVNELGPTRSLIDIEKNVTINAELVIVVQSFEEMDQLERKSEEMFEFAQSMGAKTCQLRVKMLFLQVTQGDGKNTAEISGTEVDQDIATDGSEALAVQFDAAYQRYNRTQVLNDLDKAIDLGISVAHAEYDTPSTAIGHLEKLVGLLHVAYTKTRSSDKLHLAAQYTKTILGLVQSESDEDEPSVPTIDTSVLCGLAHDLRFHAPTCDQRPDDIDDAVEIAEAAVKFSDSTEFDTVNLLSALPTPSGRRAVDVESDIVSNTIARYVLAVCLKFRYQHGGPMEDLERAIDTLQKAIKLSLRVPVDARANHVLMVSRLGLMLRLRYQKVGNLQDLNLAIERMEAEIQELSDVSDAEKREEHHIEILTNLGLVLSTKWERTRSLEDCQKSVKYSKMAVEQASPNHPAYAGLLSNLAGSLHSKFKMTKVNEELDQAIEYATEAVSLTECRGGNHVVLIDTSAILLDSFYYREDDNALQQAVEYAQQAADALPDNFLGRASIISRLGTVLETAQRYQPNDETAGRLLELYTQAWSCEMGDLTTKIAAARKGATLLVDAERYEEAREILSDAIQLLTDVAPRWMASQDRQYIVSQFTGMPSDAAAAHINSGTTVSQSSIYAGLRCLELGRGVILGSFMDYRSEAKALEEASPDLCKDFNQTCLELDSLAQERSTGKRSKRRQELLDNMKKVIALIRTIPDLQRFSPPLALGSLAAYQLEKSSPELFRTFNRLQQSLDALPEEEDDDRQSQRQRVLAAKLDSFIPKIRALPGLEDFLLPLSLSSTLELANEGPIVIVNSSAIFWRSDAIIVRSTGLHSVQLPELKPSDIHNWMDELQEIAKGWTLPTFGAKNKRMIRFLEWLWKSAVKPILKELGYIPAVKTEKKPRIYWIGTGRLSGAPFHAAGDCTSDPVEGAMDYVVSSYTPTLRALSYARQSRDRKLSQFRRDSRFLLVSAPEVYGAASLPLVLEEVAAVKTIAKSKMHIVQLDEATARDVLQELPLSNIVHFASHGFSNPTNLENSHLLLNDPDMSDSSTILTVRQIRARTSPAAELAYLSACSAAENSSPYVADEAIHIASAFQMAGFRHVVGTLCQTKDRACKEVAEEFYRALFDEDAKEELPVAEALHGAAEKLRERNLRTPLVWAPFVHFGG